MTSQEIFDISRIYFSFVSFDSIRAFHEKPLDHLDIDGDYETGYFKQVSKDKFVKCNERVDVSVVVINMNGEEITEAIRLVHYHRAGTVYEITYFK